MQFNYPALILLTETWLSPDDPNSYFLCREHYSVFRKDREAGSRGGVAILVRNDVASVYHSSLDGSTAEGATIELVACKTKCLVSVFYRRNTADVQGASDIIAYLQNISSLNLPHIVTGDFNLPDISWDSLVAPNRCSQDSILMSFLELGLSQIVTIPTRANNTLDLVFVTEHNLATDVETHPLSDSDHFMVSFLLNFSVSSGTSAHSSLCYRRMDSGLMQTYLDLVNWPLILGNDSVSSMWPNFLTFYREFIELFVPRITVPSSSRRKQKLPKFIRKLNIKYRGLRRRFASNPNDVQLS